MQKKTAKLKVSKKLKMIKEISLSDKQRVLEISANIWEGDDYISQVFDDWVNDDGLFVGLWEDNILVGFGKLSYLTPTDIWLEGLRKDEKSGVKQVGEKLSEYYYNHLQGRKIDSIRFSTYFGNLASIKLNQKFGFQKILTLSLKTKTISSKKSIQSEVYSHYDLENVKRYIEKSSYLKGTKGFIGKGWVVQKFSENLLQEFHRADKILVKQESGIIKGCAIWSVEHYQNIIWISFLEADSQHILQELLTAVNNIGYDQKKEEMQILVPDGKLLDFCNKQGFSSWEQDHDFLLFELPKTLILKITGS